jgi:hypothetical protein
VSGTDRTMDAVGSPVIEDRVASPGARLLDRDKLVAEAHSRRVAGAG